ncbi:MAG: hypothetical protein G01um101470_433 [Parcubacteria group bacterium Gr01-1014_70]|nr:MAG: hypothetical protein G01um101470_433 [Parcubacteria group bacterium Gr01-1014_70]
MFTLLIFLIVIAVLVLSHEFGHFIVAKWKGMRVDEFGFGFPPRLFGRQFGETFYSVNLLPFGGFVRIWGEDDPSFAEASEGAVPELSRNFASRSVWDRFLVLVAGVFMNFVLAYIIFIVGHGMGIPSVLGDTQTARDVVVRVVDVIPGSPAERAGIRMGDGIRELRSASETLSVTEITEVQEFVKDNAGRDIVLTLERGSNKIELPVIIRAEAPAGEGLLGIAMAKIGIVSVPWYRAPWEGLRTTFSTTKVVANGLLFFFTNIFSVEVRSSVAGPVGIAQVAGEASALGFIYLLQLVAVLSINLALLNLLPIPALDGGRVFFLLVEKLRGAPVSMRTSQFAHTAGFVVLIFLMLVVTYFDLTRIL